MRLTDKVHVSLDARFNGVKYAIPRRDGCAKKRQEKRELHFSEHDVPYAGHDAAM